MFWSPAQGAKPAMPLGPGMSLGAAPAARPAQPPSSDEPAPGAQPTASAPAGLPAASSVPPAPAGQPVAPSAPPPLAVPPAAPAPMGQSGVPAPIQSPAAPPPGGYAPPAPSQAGPPTLASPWRRLGAHFIDMGLYVLVGALFFYAADSHKDFNKFMSAGVIVASVVNIVLVAMRGQSVGKILADIKIVSYPERAESGFVNMVVLRMWVVGVLSIIPILGGIFALVDPLFIFGDDTRCLHDKIASTCVIDV